MDAAEKCDSKAEESVKSLKSAQVFPKTSTQVPVTARNREILKLAECILDFTSSDKESVKTFDGVYYKKLESLLNELIETLPGPVTPQKLSGVDVTSRRYLSSVDRFADVHYGQILSAVMSKVGDANWFNRLPHKAPHCLTQLVSVSGSTLVLFYESLVTMLEIIKSAPFKSSELDICVYLMTQLVKSEALQSAFLDLIFKCNVIQEEHDRSELLSIDFKQIWNECVVNFVSLPERIGNKVKEELPNSFIPEHFCRICCLHILKCVDYLGNLKFHTNANLDEFIISCLSKFLSKVLLRFKGYDSLKECMQVMYYWCLENHDGFKYVIHKLLNSLDSQSIEMAATLVFTLPTESGVCDVSVLLNECILDLHSWRYVLLNKIPLMSFQNDDNVIKNLIYFLGSVQFKCNYSHVTNKLSSVNEGTNCSSACQILNDLLLQLLITWSDKSAILHTPIEQQLYISKLVILSTRFLTSMYTKHDDVSSKMKTFLRDILKTKLLNGLPVHLESTTDVVRAIGMITGECLVKDINSFHKSSEETEILLEFDYDGMKDDQMVVVNCIRSLNQYYFTQFHDIASRKLKCDIINNGDKILENLTSVVNLKDKSCDELPNMKNDETSKVSGISTEVIRLKVDVNDENDSDDEQLDSDDDLEPYDLSNDVRLIEMKKPKYLRDLIKSLVDTTEQNDPDIWIGGLTAGEELIYKQLPDDDCALGLELMDIYLSIDMKYYCENFDELRFSSALAIVVVYPAETSEFICKRFHDDVRYSIACRLFMLDLLSASAKILSSPSLDPVKDHQLSLESSLLFDEEVFSDRSNKSFWQEVVKKRIESNTRRFHQSRTKVTGKENAFSKVAGSFLFPLLRGKGEQRPGIMFRVDSKTMESPEESMLLLVHLLQTCAIIMASSINCAAAARMGKELIEATWSLRFNPEVRIRKGVISCLAAIVLAVPKSILSSDMLDDIIEAKLWLGELVNSLGVFGGKKCEVDKDCRQFAAQVLCLMDKVITIDEFQNMF